MIKKLLDFLPGKKKKAPPQPQLKIIARAEHNVSRNDISEYALKVLYRLNKSGYEAYLVGGGVRDLLLGQHPKDFDVATSAHPEEVQALFKNARLIGRRFKLVHVLFGREIIEVATFRGQEDEEEESDSKLRKSSEHGLILRDNVYGTIEEDALRRDFTVNALYYCVKDFSIHDYANGLKDIQSRTLRLIGDPEARYREDPVRMLRAVRFATKLGFTIAPETRRPIAGMGELLGHIPAARLFEEVLKLFMSGHALANFHLLRELGLFQYLFPDTDACLKSGDPHKLSFIEIALRNTDERIQSNKPVTPAFLFATLLWFPLQKEWDRLKQAGHSEFPSLHLAAQHVMDAQSNATSIPKRFGIPMKEVWEMQLRLPKRAGKRAEQTITHPRFRAAYDFLMLREEAGENLDGLGKWWTEYQSAEPHKRSKLANSTENTGRKRPPRKNNRPRRAPPADSRQNG